ncbi:hypothetical protein [Streptosporangium roseum]|uniref:hypothetical protein n=1 Tax=Streptosporangium roseum TaxID=2001 RepID=UPI003D9E40DA
MPLQSIAARVGYSDVRALRRAVQRWEERPPNVVRTILNRHRNEVHQAVWETFRRFVEEVEVSPPSPSIVLPDIATHGAAQSFLSSASGSGVSRSHGGCRAPPNS